MDENQQLLYKEQQLIKVLTASSARIKLQQQLPRLCDAMQRLKQLPAHSPARMQFDNSWMYVQAFKAMDNRLRMLQSIDTLIDDALNGQ
jgi:hypothetical protein